MTVLQDIPLLQSDEEIEIQRQKEDRRRLDGFRYNGQEHPDSVPMDMREHEKIFQCACPCGAPLGFREDVFGVAGEIVIAGHQSFLNDQQTQ